MVALLFIVLGLGPVSSGSGHKEFFSDQPVSIKSPDGSIHFIVESREGKIGYSILVNNSTVIAFSSMGLTVNGKSVADNRRILKLIQYKRNESYSFRGIHNKAVNKFNGATISYGNDNDILNVEVKVFNDGAAFRYILPFENGVVIDRDDTEFIPPPGSVIWSQPNTSYYEGTYSKKLLDTVSAGRPMGPPVTIELAKQSLYVSITEGGLTDFAGMSLITGGAGILRANLAGTTKKKGLVESPWRIIMIGRDLNSLVNCDIVANVSVPFDKKLFPKGFQTEWIKPGRSVWSWLSPQRSITLDNMKRFSDLAAELGFEYNLVDEGWSNWKENNRDAWEMMKELVEYSGKKGVKIWVWKAYPDRKGIPGINNPEKRRDFFKKCKEIGVVGLKIDFFDSESQEVIDFYQAALKDAATYQLMINFHGANKPTGEMRTWPNEMTREAIRGMENRPPWAGSNTILPFTRYLAGHADFTPVHFGDRMGEVTWAHHVASMIIFTSPFLCIGADPESILDNPCRQMIQSIPATWDETIVLPQSRIGELAVYARRKGDDWFLAGMSSLPDTMIYLKTDFLSKGKYKLELVEDVPNKQNEALILNKNLEAGEVLKFHLNTNGGVVARFERIK